jgi:hypothetical protein
MMVTSFDKPLFFIGVGLFLVGLIDLIIFGGSLGSRYLLLGSTFQFQGPSYFFAVGLLPLMLGVGFMIYSVITWRKITIAGTETQLQITESYWYRKASCDIPTNQILQYSLTNSKTNKRHFLLLLLIPYFSFNVNNGIGNLALHQITDFPLTGFTLLISILIVLVLIVSYFAGSTWGLTVHTDQGYYLLKFVPTHNPSRRSVFELMKGKLQMVNLKEIQLKTAHPRHFITIGICVVLISAYNILFSHLLISFLENLNAWLAFYVGFMMILRETKKNNTKNATFGEREKKFQGFNWSTVGNKMGLYLIPLIVSVNCLLAVIYNWIGVVSDITMIGRVIVSTVLNLMLISTNIYYFFMAEMKK